MGLVKFPAASIFNFSQICGSGEKGASPKVRQSTTRIGIGIDWIKEIIIVGLDQSQIRTVWPTSCHLFQLFDMLTLFFDNGVELSTRLLVIDQVQ